MEECYWMSNYSVEQFFGSHESKWGRRPNLLNRLSSNWVGSPEVVWWYEKFERKDLNHFGLGRGLRKPTKDEIDDQSPYSEWRWHGDSRQRWSQEQCQEVDKEVAKMRKRDVSMPDEAEGQRLNLSSVMKLTDMSKLSLGRMKLVQSTLVISCIDVYSWI